MTKASLKQEWNDIRVNSQRLVNIGNEIVLGIKANTGNEGIEALKSWTDGLQLPKNKLRAYSDDGAEISVNELSEVQVYIKYNSTDSNGDAYMKKYNGDNFNGVILQVKTDSEFYQYGDFPLFLFGKPLI